MKKKVRNNIKNIFIFSLGVILTLSISVTAEQQIESTGVTYTTKTGEIETVNNTLDDLIALSDTFTNDFKTEIINEAKTASKKDILETLYPVGSIYITTKESTIGQVYEKFKILDEPNNKVEWEVYSAGKTLVGHDGTNYITNNEIKGNGGSLTKTGKFTPNVTISNYTGNTGSHAITIAEMPAHNHGAGYTGSFYSTAAAGTAWYVAAGDVQRMTTQGQGQGHNHTMNHGHTLTNNTSDISVGGQDPYTVVYMYRRTK